MCFAKLHVHVANELYTAGLYSFQLSWISRTLHTVRLVSPTTDL